MRKLHPQETLIETFQYKGISVDLVKWEESIWCGSLGYADNPEDELDVGAISDRFLAIDTASVCGRLESDGNVCMNIHHIDQTPPVGVMFAYLVDTEQQPEGLDVFKLPAGQYMCIPLGDNSVATAIGVEPWYGGPPPHEWVGEHIAPHFGYACAGDALPVIEYYACENGEWHAWMYVPVEKDLR